MAKIIMKLKDMKNYSSEIVTVAGMDSRKPPTKTWSCLEWKGSKHRSRLSLMVTRLMRPPISTTWKTTWPIS